MFDLFWAQYTRGWPYFHRPWKALAAQELCPSDEWSERWRELGVMCFWLFPTCQVRVVRFYVSCRSSFSSLLFSSLLFSSLPSAGPQPRPSTPSVRCRTSTTTIHAQCSLPDLNHDHPRPVFAAGPQPRPRPVFGAGPQPRPATPSVRCRTSTTTSHAQCSLPDLNHDHQRQVFPAGPQPPERVPKEMPDRMSDRTSDRVPDRMSEDMTDRMSEDMPDRMAEDMTDRMSEDMPDRMSEDTPDRMPDRMSEDIPDRMSDRMPDRMSDRMPDRM